MKKKRNRATKEETEKPKRPLKEKKLQNQQENKGRKREKSR